jgi:hypothetical protein
MACCVFFLLDFSLDFGISSHHMIFIVYSIILLSFCAFIILEYLLGYSLEIVCMKILFYLCVGLILIYLGHLEIFLIGFGSGIRHPAAPSFFPPAHVEPSVALH